MEKVHPGPNGLSPAKALGLPLAFAAALVAMALLIARGQPHLMRAILGAAAGLVVWNAALYEASRRRGRALALTVGPRKQHGVQALAQIAVISYWGWHVRLVYAFVPLMIAQVIFAYGVESLLTWSRRDRYTLGFGPVPIVLSINLFLWFRPEWFHWQFVMIALGYLAKELIRWSREGRSAHIFNPSSFPLAVFSLALIAMGASDTTLGSFIANTQFDPPHIYLVIFLAALPGQLLFGVARMTLASVLTVFVISVAYFQVTGTYLFYDAYIPVPVFLGMHLLFTDPSTSPRSELGRILFGVLYGLGTVTLFVLLSSSGEPTFYDKLLPVPLMNLTVRGIDRLVASEPWARLDPARIGRGLAPGWRNLAYTSVWSGVFLAMSAGQAVGDRHPGQYLPFWKTACGEGRSRACSYASYLTLSYCNNGSGWACNEAAIEEARSGSPAGPTFQRACKLGFPLGCENAERAGTGGGEWVRSGPLLEDLPIVLRGTKPVLEERDPARLTAMACEQGWPDACE